MSSIPLLPPHGEAAASRVLVRLRCYTTTFAPPKIFSTPRHTTLLLYLAIRTSPSLRETARRVGRLSAAAGVRQR